MPSTSFTVDAVLFDMDGTLTDSIAAVEAAWGKVAQDIGQDPVFVIDSTHGKRAIDNLTQFKPHIKAHEMDAEVQAFEESILYYADAYNTHGPGSRKNSMSFLMPPTFVNSGATTPELAISPYTSSPSSTPPSRMDSSEGTNPRRRSSFSDHLNGMLRSLISQWNPMHDDLQAAIMMEEGMAGGFDMPKPQVKKDIIEAWKLEAAGVDRSVRILPGVKRMIESIPNHHYAVATSGAKTYAYGCMTRVGITPPPVTITADDKRLKAGKPAPDPFLLAAACLGFDAKNCVVFEDSPSGIRAGVASGAVVIAVCTSHEREKIENCGAHYIVENMEKVTCMTVEIEGQLKLKFVVEA